MTDASRGAAHFQRLYAMSPDPWHYRSSAYERAKYRRTIAALQGRRFRSGFEAGCSIGGLTHMLAAQCDSLLAVDIVDEPLRIARATCADQPWVRLRRMHIPREWPDERFDLIVLSEVLYFLVPSDIASVADHVDGTLAPDGVVLLVNWLGQADDPCTGDQAARIFIDHASGWLASGLHHREDAYRVDMLGRH
jgi:2-polyprenyl-3-methyl-5-hydroxy-6-metoxy-1,4-benzoquinol methylase